MEDGDMIDAHLEQVRRLLYRLALDIDTLFLAGRWLLWPNDCTGIVPVAPRLVLTRCSPVQPRSYCILGYRLCVILYSYVSLLVIVTILSCSSTQRLGVSISRMRHPETIVLCT